ncbi:serine/threonine-protein kinase [Botrimarina mediterranea]|uniref:serine/threonine-protein kinase n=1 Tax=Botrimarina mediterranea TaxID=2528022 RepID=UPI0011891B15|nr:Serine/threonine-protein kinase PknH [Planctomycetes bacterium K2D]
MTESRSISNGRHARSAPTSASSTKPWRASATASKSEAAIPAAWRPLIERFEERTAAGAPPSLEEALAEGSDADGLLYELVATYHSRRELQGATPATCGAELLAANPHLRGPILEAFGRLTALGGAEGLSPEPAFGDYLLVRQLGAGGYGEVYLGCHRLDARLVVLKHADDPRRTAALRREKASLQRLAGIEGVPAFRDWLDLDDGGTVLVTEFCTANPLDRQVDLAPPSPRQTAEWVAHICGVLDRAHAADVFHCDLKPENVLIDAATGRASLIDFGVAHAAPLYERGPLARAKPVGSPWYAAPELLAGAAASPRLVDVFGVGAVLYYLITGAAPREPGPAGEPAESAGDHGVDYARLEAADAPEGLKAVCREALDPDPLRRPQHPRAIVERLFAAGLLPPPPSSWAPLGRRLLPFAAMVALAAIAAAANWRPTTAIPSQWSELAALQKVELPSLRAEDFRVGVGYGEDVASWEPDADRTELRPQLVVAFPNRLYDVADGLRARVGNRPWKWPSLRPEKKLEVYFRLDPRDLEAGDELTLAIGGGDLLDGPVVAGPFVYKIDLREAFRRHEADLLSAKIARAQAATPIAFRNGEWLVPRDFARDFGGVVARLEFGTDGRLDRSTSRREEPLPYYTDYGTTAYLALDQAFVHDKGDLDAHQAVWARVVYVNGVASTARPYYAVNQFGHNGGVEEARRHVERIAPATPLARYKGDRFVLDGLAQVGGALGALEVAGPPGTTPLTLAVEPAPSTDGPHGADEVRRHLEDCLVKTPTTATASIANGVMLAPVLLPPVWPWADIVCRFRDGSRLGPLRVSNQRPLPGVEAMPAHKSAPATRLCVAFEGPTEDQVEHGAMGRQNLPDLRYTLIGVDRPSMLQVAGFSAEGVRTRNILRLLPEHLTVTCYTGPHRGTYQSEFVVRKQEWLRAIREAYRPTLPAVVDRLVRLCVIGPTVDARGNRLALHPLTERVNFYADTRRAAGFTGKEPVTVLAGAPNAGYWLCVRELRYRVADNGPWRSVPISWNDWYSASWGGDWTSAAPVFVTKLPAEAQKVSVCLVLDDGAVTTPVPLRPQLLQ